MIARVSIITDAKAIPHAKFTKNICLSCLVNLEKLDFLLIPLQEKILYKNRITLTFLWILLANVTKKNLALTITFFQLSYTKKCSPIWAFLAKKKCRISYHVLMEVYWYNLFSIVILVEVDL